MDSSELFSELKMTLPNDIISTLEILDFVKVVNCYPNNFIAYSILLTFNVTVEILDFVKVNCYPNNEAYFSFSP